MTRQSAARNSKRSARGEGRGGGWFAGCARGAYLALYEQTARAGRESERADYISYRNVVYPRTLLPRGTESSNEY